MSPLMSWLIISPLVAGLYLLLFGLAVSAKRGDEQLTTDAQVAELVRQVAECDDPTHVACTQINSGRPVQHRRISERDLGEDQPPRVSCGCGWATSRRGWDGLADWYEHVGILRAPRREVVWP